MARNATNATAANGSYAYAFRASTDGGTDGAPMRSVYIRCDEGSASSLLVIVNPVDEATAVTLVAGDERAISVGDTRAISSIQVQGATGTATYTFWPMG